MATSEWLRTFLAIYRSGSVSAGASRRGLSQPAASQQLRSLERSVGTPLFVRSRDGVDPTRSGRELYVSVADAAEYLGVSTRTIRAMIHDGRLTGYRNGKRLVRLDLNDIDAKMVPSGGGC